MKHNRFIIVSTLFIAFSTIGNALSQQPPNYEKQIVPILKKYCFDCHSGAEAESKFRMDSYSRLLKGGKKGKAILPGDAAKSRLLAMVKGKKKPFMPPEDNPKPTAKAIQLIEAWIKAGAKSNGPIPGIMLENIPHIPVRNPPRKPITAIAFSSNGRFLASASFRTVTVFSAATQKKIVELRGIDGNVNDIGFSRDCQLFYAVGGEPGLQGEIVIWNTQNWQKKRTFKGHDDSIYAAAMNPDGKLLATGSYDKSILIWNLATGKVVTTIEGHQGAVFDLAFHPQGKMLASSSDDSTVKLWDVKSGHRIDTLGQPEKAQYALAFHPSGKFLVAGGADNRIRVWRIGVKIREGSSPLLFSKFAHDKPILDLAFSPQGKVLYSSGEDRALKAWDAKTFSPIEVIARLDDWSNAISLSSDGKKLSAGLMNGQLKSFDVSSLKSRGIVNRSSTDTLENESSATVTTIVPLKQVREQEPNDTRSTATMLRGFSEVDAVLNSGKNRESDEDWYRIRAKKGERWVIETTSDAKKSLVDTKLDVYDAQGKPVLKCVLQAVRDSSITFRPIDSRQGEVRLTNWQEMDLREYLYMAGEVCKIYRMPRGPDSGTAFFTMNGKRRCYFGSSSTAHPLDEPVYIVQPHPANATLADNGLPVFPVYYSNDDDPDGKLGKNARIHFNAPKSGDYFIEVSDVRGFAGKDHNYKLKVRPRVPDFDVRISGKNAKIPTGSGQRFTVNISREDGFEGSVRIDISGMPKGFSATSPIVVEAGHNFARGTINVSPDLSPTWFPQPKPKKNAKKKIIPFPLIASKPLSLFDWDKVKITATAIVGGREVTKAIGNFGKLQISPRPRILVKLLPDQKMKSVYSKSDRIVVQPGTMTTALLKVQRFGFKGDIKFDIDNLPHGIIVDNIGLSGILIRKNETERVIEFKTASWVKPTQRFIHAVSQVEGRQSSRPVLLEVRGVASKR